MKTSGIWAKTVLLCLVLAGMPGRLPFAHAADQVVTHTGDDGPGSLRQAIADVHDGGTITFELTYPATIYLTSGALSIDKSLTLTGPGANRLTISGNGSSRVFTVSGSDTEATLSGLTIADGQANMGGGISNEFSTLALLDCVIRDNVTGYSYWGGGLYNNQGLVTITRCTISGNKGGYGGGLENSRGTVEIADSLIRDNSTSGAGGGIHNYGDLRVTGTTFDGNSADDSGGGAINSQSYTLSVTGCTFTRNYASYGAAIHSHLDTVTVVDTQILSNTAVSGGGLSAGNSTTTLVNSTIRDNVVSDVCGGLCNGGEMTVTGCTISGNSAGMESGGISNHGELTLINSTVSHNVSNRNGGGLYSGGKLTLIHTTVNENAATLDGGGLYVYSDTLTLDNSLVLNSPSGGDCVNVGATIQDAGHNLVGDGSCGFPTVGRFHPGPLQDNGGPTFTHALSEDSPALDAGDCAGGTIRTDQRGVARPQGWACDIGAFELEMGGPLPAVPEASTLVLLGSAATGLAGYAALQVRRRRR